MTEAEKLKELAIRSVCGPLLTASGGGNMWRPPQNAMPCPTCAKQSGPNKRTVCVDFDGVLHSFTTPWNPGDPPMDAPVPGASHFLKHLHEAGCRILIFSCRNETAEGVKQMKRWLTGHGFYYVDHFEFPRTKPIADVYIDDRAIPFRGEFPTINQVMSFKPWNR